MQKGYLIFELRKDNGATPISNAQVKITKIDGREVNHLLNVDESGKTDKFEVYTKDKSLTFDKFNREIPYTEVDAEVRFENDKIIFIDGIQIYSDILSIQEVKIDNREGKFRSNKDKKGKSKKHHVHFKNHPPCVLEGEHSDHTNNFKQDEKSIKPVLKTCDIFIPEFIIVHIGCPGDDGEVLAVPFIDYIKNVSCSSVYPTWSREAICANVHSIISFTLNRIYTDWYKSKGYGFDITSSSEDDQMYVKGRNLFRNVCDIVDEIFYTCIRVNGFSQPFLAKCYNFSNCSGRSLSRWGSFDLAEDGFGALDILKKYYGDNIELVNVDDVGGIINRNPQRNLSVGSVGDDVRFIQKALNTIAKQYVGISKILNEDGIFGENTRRAVRDFQRIFNLDADGIVGVKTWNKISLLYALIKKIFDNSNNIEEIIRNAFPMELGSKGEDVKNIQKSLNFIFKKYGSFDKLDEDGYFGEKTRDAVKEFQKRFGLVVDGIVGKDTIDRIKYVEKNINDLSMFVPNVSDDNEEFIEDIKQLKDDFRLILSLEEIEIPMKFGDQGENVKSLQRELNNLSKYYGFLEKLDEDGIFGPKTKETILKFQKRFGLNVDGIFGEESLKKLVSLNKALEELQIDGDCCNIRQDKKEECAKKKNYIIDIDKSKFKSEYSMEYPNFNLEYGCTCGYVILVQKYINSIKKNNKNYFSNNDEILENGKFDDNTLKHIKEFQDKIGYDKNGIIDKLTWNNLVNEYEKFYTK